MPTLRSSFMCIWERGEGAGGVIDEHVSGIVWLLRAFESSRHSTRIAARWNTTNKTAAHTHTHTHTHTHARTHAYGNPTIRDEGARAYVAESAGRDALAIRESHVHACTSAHAPASLRYDCLLDCRTASGGSFALNPRKRSIAARRAAFLTKTERFRWCRGAWLGLARDRSVQHIGYA